MTRWEQRQFPALAAAVLAACGLGAVAAIVLDAAAAGGAPDWARLARLAPELGLGCGLVGAGEWAGRLRRSRRLEAFLSLGGRPSRLAGPALGVGAALGALLSVAPSLGINPSSESTPVRAWAEPGAAFLRVEGSTRAFGLRLGPEGPDPIPPGSIPSAPPRRAPRPSPGAGAAAGAVGLALVAGWTLSGPSRLGDRGRVGVLTVAWLGGAELATVAERIPSATSEALPWTLGTLGALAALAGWARVDRGLPSRSA